MLNEGVKLKATWDLQLFDENGILKQREVKENLIVNDGYDLILDSLLKEVSRPATANYIAIGTNNTAAAATQTALLAEVGTRVIGTYSHTAGTKVATLSGTFPANNPSTAQAITEAGLFNAPTDGTMFNRVVFSVINKEPADTLTITVTLTLT